MLSVSGVLDEQAAEAESRRSFAAGDRQSGANGPRRRENRGHGVAIEGDTRCYVLWGTDGNKFGIGGIGGWVKVKAGGV